MKRILALLLSVLLCVPAAMEAGSVTVDVAFDRDCYELGNLGFEICLPDDWVIEDGDEDFFLVAYDGKTDAGLVLYVFEADGASLAEIAGGIDEVEDFEVMMMTLNGIDFAFYEDAVDGMFGALTTSPDGEFCLWFMFAPLGDKAFEALALQILGSLARV